MSDSKDKKDEKLSEEEEELDEWDERIFSTGCSVEQTKMNDCYYGKKDWRSCKEEIEVFRKCWKSQGNDQRTETKDALFIDDGA